jgi:biotin carboxylase
VPQPRLLARFASMDEVDAFDWSSVRFPVIVKPIDLSSSFYVRLCEDADAARKVYRRIFMHSQSFAGVAFSAQGLLEEVAYGPEYSVECVVQDGRVAALFLTTKFLSAYPSCDEVGHLTGETFADEHVEAEVRRAVEGIVRAWQVTAAVMHVEFKLCDGAVKVIEGACRIGGDMISTITEMKHGVSLEECLVLLRCGASAAPALARRHAVDDGWYYGIKYLFSETLSTPVGADIEVLESVRHAKEDSGPGGGFGVESRLGHTLVRSRALGSLKAYLASLGGGGAE